MAFKSDWAAAKAAFKTASGKSKKPSSTWTKLFGTGIEAALEKCDTAKDPEKWISGAAAFDKAKDSYLKDLEKAKKDAKGDAAEAAVDNLIKALKKIAAEVDAEAKVQVAAYDEWKKSGKAKQLDDTLDHLGLGGKK